MRRGDFVTVATQGDYGKPRPALVVQNDLFDALPSAVILPLTSLLRDDADQIRIDGAPSDENVLREKSQVAGDKVTAIPGSTSTCQMEQASGLSTPVWWSSRVSRSASAFPACDALSKWYCPLSIQCCNSVSNAACRC